MRKRTAAAQQRFLEQLAQNEEARQQRLTGLRKEASKQVKSKRRASTCAHDDRCSSWLTSGRDSSSCNADEGASRVSAAAKLKSAMTLVQATQRQQILRDATAARSQMTAAEAKAAKARAAAEKAAAARLVAERAAAATAEAARMAREVATRCGLSSGRSRGGGAGPGDACIYRYR